LNIRFFAATLLQGFNGIQGIIQNQRKPAHFDLSMYL
jgi:hypothetical protein